MTPSRLPFRLILRLASVCVALLLGCAAPARVYAQAGKLDTNFLPTVDGKVTSIALQGDKIIICGDFTTVDGSPLPFNHIARLNADGTLDPTFLPGTAADGTIESVAVKADGGIVIAGNFTHYNGTLRGRVALLKSNGTLDTSFAPSSGADANVNVVRVQTDGAIVIGGQFGRVNGVARNFFARLSKTGVLDTAYYPGTGPDNSIFDLFIHDDGTVVIGGAFNKVNGSTRNYCARLLPTGALDTTFNPSLTANSSFSVSSVLTQPDGRVVLGGYFGGIDGTTGDKVFSLARFYGDGNLDYTFDPYTGANATVFSLALQPDNAIVVGGYFVVLRGQTRNGVGRLYSTGDLDPTFDPGAGANGAVLAVAVQTNGKVVVGGVFTNFAGVPRPYLARLDSYPPVVNSIGSVTAQVGTPFSYQLASTPTPAGFGATGLPPGLTLASATGLISGTPTQAGNYPVAVSATNGSGTGTGTLTINVLPLPPAVTSGPPPNGVVGAAYSFQVTAAPAPTNFAATGLPPGLALDPGTGFLSGVPTQSGTFSANFTLTDAGGSTTTSYGITIAPAPPVITSPVSAGGTVGQPFAYKIVASNNPANYNAANLPPGLTVDTGTGSITGTPTQPGTSTVTLSATNAGGTGTLPLTLTILAAPIPVITSLSAPPAQVKSPYSFTLTATNSPSGYAASGLPPGLTLDPGTGLISGTPTSANTFTASVSATNAYGTGPASVLAFVVNPPPAYIAATNILNPPSGSTVVLNDTIYPYVLVQAIASTVAEVDLYADDPAAPGTPLFIGRNTTSILFRLAWTPPHAGAYTLRAVATDILGSVSTAELPISVADAPVTTVPPVKLIEGLEGKFFAPGSTLTLVTDVGDSDDPLQSVTIFADGKPLDSQAASRTAARSAEPDADATGSAARSFPPVSYTLPTSGESVAITVSAQTVHGLRGLAIGSIIAPLIVGPLTDLEIDCQITAPSAGNGTGTLPARTAAHASVTASRHNGQISQVELFINANKVPGSPQTPYEFDVPALEPGTYTFTAIATDGGTPALSKQSAPVIVTVADTTPGAPVFTSPGSDSATVGQPYAFQVAATLSPTEYGAEGLPDGLTIDPATGRISGTPTGAANVYTVTLSATNAAGTRQTTFTLTVGAAAIPTVSVTPAGNGLAAEGGANGKITVQRAGGDLSQPLTVRYRTAGAAKSGVDYKRLTGTVTIPANATEAKIKIKPLDNHTVDGTRVAKVKLLPATDGSYLLGAPLAAKIRILDND